jgi:hypothetical protein
VRAILARAESPKSLAQGNALWHGRYLSTPEALKGRNLFIPIPPFQGFAFAGHSFRRALPCAVDYRAFSPRTVHPPFEKDDL